MPLRRDALAQRFHLRCEIERGQRYRRPRDPTSSADVAVQHHWMNSISRYFGSGHSESSTIVSSWSALSRTFCMLVATLSR